MQQMDMDLLHERAQEALSVARALGASGCEVALSTAQGLATGVRLGEVENIEHSHSRGLSVTVFRGQRKGNASTGEWSSAAIAETVRKALTIADFTSEDPCAGLPEEAFLAREVPDLDVDHPREVSPEAALEMALRCERAAREFDPRITNSEGANVSTQRSAFVLANSTGWSGGYTSTSYGVSVSVVGSQDGQLERDYWYSSQRCFEDLESAEAVGQEAARRCVARLGARKLPTQKAPVLFVADQARGLVSSFVQAMGGTAQYRKSSFLLNGDGQRWFPAWFQMHEKPHLRRKFGSAPFDGEGVATREREWVIDGIVHGYLLSSYSARKLGLQTTGHASGVHNLQVQSNAGTRDDLIRSMSRGLVVTELMGQGVNAITGDYSRGAAGFWVENGAIQYPVSEITIAANLKDMYQRIEAVGSDVDDRGSIHCGSMLIGEMTIAGE
jgi:PmbA protein